MARTGRFGRLPRSAPSLTSVIVSLTQAMNARIDQNMVDAWQEGGEVDGKKITDKMLLDHLLKRRDQISTDDPMWDQANNTYLDFAFSIEESKMSLSYAEGKTNDTQMAAFYTTWANKLPHDSEAYRNLARSAAQFREAASNRAAASGARARQDSYDRQNMSTYERYQQQQERANYWLTQAAISARIINPSQTIDDLRFASGPDQALFYDLFDQIATDPDFAYIRQGLALSGLGGLNYSTFTDLNSQWVVGQDARINLALSFGDREEAEKLRYEKYDFQTTAITYLDLDEMAGYKAARDLLLGVLDNQTSDPDMVRGALDDYRRQLERLYGSAQSDDARLMLSAEIAALNGEQPAGRPGQLTAAEEGAVAPQGADRVGDLDSTVNLVNQMNFETEALRNGSAVMHKVRDDAGTFVGWELIPTAGNATLTDRDAGALVDVRSGLRGQARTEWMEYHPIMSIGRTDVSTSTGRPQTDLTPTDDQQIGVYFIKNGITWYGIYHDGGQVAWTTDSPFRAVGTGVDVKVGTDNTMTVMWDVPTTPGRAGAVPAGQYNPFAVVEDNMKDMDLQRGNRYDTIESGLVQKDPTYRTDLLRRFPTEKAAEFEAMYANHPPGTAEAVMGAWMRERDIAGTIVQREWEKNNRTHDVRGGFTEFADMQLGPGYGLAAGRNPLSAEPPTPEQAAALEANRLKLRGDAARARAAEMVAQSQFRREQGTVIAPRYGAGAAAFAERRGSINEQRYRELLRAASAQAANLPVIALPGMDQSGLEAWVRAQGGYSGEPRDVRAEWEIRGLGVTATPRVGPAKPSPFTIQPTTPTTTAPKPKPIVPKPIPQPVDPRDLGEAPIPKPPKPPQKIGGFQEY